MKKGFAPVLIIILVILTLVAAVIGLRFYDQKYNNWKEEGPPILTKDHLASLPSPTTQDQTANWKTYKSDKSGWQISYPGDYRIINGGKSCAIPGGSPGDENTFCFFSPGFGPDNNFSDLGFQVRTESNDEPVKSQEALADCTFLKEEDCKQVIVGNYIKTKKFLYTYVDQGITEKQERIFLLSPSKEHIITIEFNYRPCEKDVTSNCLKQEDYDSKSSQILGTFKFL